MKFNLIHHKEEGGEYLLSLVFPSIVINKKIECNNDNWKTTKTKISFPTKFENTSKANSLYMDISLLGFGVSLFLTWR
jgi:hypothetical protein